MDKKWWVEVIGVIREAAIHLLRRRTEVFAGVFTCYLLLFRGARARSIEVGQHVHTVVGDRRGSEAETKLEKNEKRKLSSEVEENIFARTSYVIVV